jgi:hypothetical protein
MVPINRWWPQKATRISSTEHGDQLVVLRCRMPTRPLLDLSATGPHTKSSGTQCSVTHWVLTRWCGASYLPPTGPLPQKGSVGESPGNQSMTCSCPSDDGDAGVLPPRRASFWTSMLMKSLCVASSCSMLTGGRGGGGGGGLPCWACPQPHPQPMDLSGISRVASLAALVHTICHK